MSEKLIPFNWDEFVKDPMRLRQLGGADGPPQWAEPVRGNVVVMWQLTVTPLVYWGSQFSAYLRLAAKTRTIKVRLHRSRSTGCCMAQTSDYSDLTALVGGGYEWVGEAFDVEVAE